MPLGSTAWPVIVVGGGVAGLVLARDLAIAGEKVVLVEATDRLGGQVRRHRLAGLDLDAGAEAYATRNPSVPELAEELGLGGDLVSPNPAGSWLFTAESDAYPLPATSLLGIPGVIDEQLERVLGAQATARVAADAELPTALGADAVTLGELVRVRMGDAVVDRLVAPVTTGVHSAHPDALPLDRVAPGLRAALAREGSLATAVRTLREQAPAGSAVGGIRGGMARLVDELESELAGLGVDVHFGTPAEDVTPTSVTVGAERLHGTVVVAAPGVLAPASIRPATVVTLVVERPELAAAPRGSGVLVAPGAPVTARALTHQSAKWQWLAEAVGGLDVLRLSYEHPVPIETARGDASTLLGVTIRPGDIVESAVVEWERSGIEPGAEHPQVGEAASGTGLASVVQHARATARRLLAVGGTREHDVRLKRKRGSTTNDD